MTADMVLCADPGVQHSAGVVCRIESTLDRYGAPLLTPLDGVTVERSPDECPEDTWGKPRKHGVFHGQIRYAERVQEALLDLLDRHNASDRLAAVFIEGFVLPQGLSHRALVDSVWLNAVIGYLAGQWPEHHPVAPAGSWPGHLTTPKQTGARPKEKSGWDHDPEPSPQCLVGRRPTGWTRTTGVHRGTHQRSAYNMGRAGWRALNGITVTKAEKVRAFRHAAPYDESPEIRVARQLPGSRKAADYVDLAIRTAAVDATPEIVRIAFGAMLLNHPDTDDVAALEAWVRRVADGRR